MSRKITYLFLWFNLFCISCVREKGIDIKNPLLTSPADTSIFPSDTDRIIVTDTSYIEKQMLILGLVDVAEKDSSIITDIKYSTNYNFLNSDVYGNYCSCYLQADVADKLVRAQRFLKTQYPHFNLVVFDCARPAHIQQLMWDTLNIPLAEKIKYLTNPKHGSLHNYGAAVDLSIMDSTGKQLDMGTSFDYFGELAHPEKEVDLMASGQITVQQVKNRKVLRYVMSKAGFFNIQTEWWHFNSCSREVAKQKYSLIP